MSNKTLSNLLASPPQESPKNSLTKTRLVDIHDAHLYNPAPQNAPGASAAKGHTVENSIPLSIFPIATDRFLFAFCGLPGRGKTHISRRTARLVFTRYILYKQ